MGSASGKQIKTISFNTKNANEAAMLKHVKRRNFSGYVKKLIWADMMKGQEAGPDAAQEPAEDAADTLGAPEPAKAQESPPRAQESAAERLERLKQKGGTGSRPAQVFKPINQQKN